jgi:hypothetical protein
MKKKHILGLSLLAVFAFSAIAAASAFAESPEWLINEKAVEANTATLTVGEITLTELEGPLGVHAGVLCSGDLDGTVGAAGVDLVEKLLALETETEIVFLAENGLSCVNVENCSGGTPLVWAEGLPWDSVLVLSAGVMLDVVLNAAYEVDCVNSLVGLLEDLCEQAETAATLTNISTGVNGLISEENKGLCTLSGKIGSPETARKPKT